MADTAIAVIPKTQLVSADDFMPVLTVNQAVERKKLINDFIHSVMREDEDYGAISGGQKAVLLKPGAEKLCSIFGLAQRYIDDQVIEDWTGIDHDGEPFLYYRVRCQLWRDDRSMGEASGSCNSWEQKYRWRDSKRTCPKCGAESIIAGKAEYGGGWLCWQKRGGCGAKFAEEDQTIIGQQIGRVSNPDIADSANTILKMAQKRALVAAVLVVTNCSDAFAQELDDIDTGGHAVGTQAASDYIRDRKLAESRQAALSRRGSDPRGEADTRAGSPEGGPIPSPSQPAHPAPLQTMLDAVAKPGNVKFTFDLMKQTLIEAMPANGEAEYKHQLEKHGIRAGVKVDVLRACLTEMWNIASFAREQAAKAAPFQATDDDLPFEDEPAEATK